MEDSKKMLTLPIPQNENGSDEYEPSEKSTTAW
jgi:hypothetical protein